MTRAELEQLLDEYKELYCRPPAGTTRTRPVQQREDRAAEIRQQILDAVASE